MANKIQVLRNAAIAKDRATAKTTLNTQLATLNDGEIAICRYQTGSTDSDKAVKVLLGFYNTIGEGTKQFIFDADAIPADVQTALDAITGKIGAIEKIKDEIIGESTDSKDAETVYGAKAYADDKVNALDVTDTVTVGSFVTKVDETDGKVSTTKAALSNYLTSANKTVTLTTTNGVTSFDVNIDGSTIVKDSNKGTLSVASSALTQYVGKEAIAVSTADTSNNKTVSLTINGNDKVLTQGTTGLLTTLSIAYDSDNRKIQLKGKDNAEISSIDATAFVKDGMLNDAKVFLATDTSQSVTFKGGSHTFKGLTKGNHYIGFEFATKGGASVEYTYDVLDATSIIDVYVAGDGLALTDHTFKVKKDTTSTDSEAFLSVSASGVKVSGVQNAIDTAAKTIDDYVGKSDIPTGKTVMGVIAENEETAADAINALANAAGVVDSDDKICYVPNSNSNYIKSATSLNNADVLLDAEIKKLNDAKVSVAASTDTESKKYLGVSESNNVYTVKVSGVDSAISTAISGLKKDSVGGTGKVITTVSEANGVISATAIELTAANVGATPTAATTTAVAVTGTTVAAQIASLAASIAVIDCGTY